MLVLAPTRELAMQVARDFKDITKKLTVACFYGGTAYNGQCKLVSLQCLKKKGQYRCGGSVAFRLIDGATLLYAINPDSVVLLAKEVFTIVS